MTFDWSTMRGFNYQPSYAARLEYAWSAFDLAVWDRETSWAKRFGSNTLRIWLDWGAFLAMGDRLFDVFDQALASLDRNGLKAMPVLFNRWIDPNFPAGAVSDNDLRTSGWGMEKFDPYVDGVLKRFGADQRIRLWDLCNEPQGTGWNAGDILHKEHIWLSNVAAAVRRHSNIPLTIGTMTGDNVNMCASLVDVISFHPYPQKVGEMEKMCVDHLAIARRFGKPLICTETCCGSFDDHERGQHARENLQTLDRHKIGWVAWLLCEGRFVSGSRERVDSNSMHPWQGYMPWVLKDGTTRPGHEWLETR